MNCYLSGLFTDPSFMGALFGAVITGMISIVVFKMQKAKENVLEKQQFEKIYNQNKRNLTFLNDSLSKTESEVKKDEYPDSKEVEVLKHYTKAVRTEIEAIDIKEVPYEIHENFADLKDALTTIELCTGILFETKVLGFLKNEYLSSIKQYDDNLKKIETFLEKNKLSSTSLLEDTK